MTTEQHYDAVVTGSGQGGVTISAGASAKFVA